MNIISLEFPLQRCQTVSFNENNSLLDSDICILNPNIRNSGIDFTEEYKTRPYISSRDSVFLKRYFAHWKHEINSLLEADKTIFIMLTRLDTVYIGRPHAKLTSNYECIPIEMKIHDSTASKMKLSAEGSFLKEYWREFEEFSISHAYIESDFITPLVQTRDGSRTLGGLYNLPYNNGRIVLLPMLNLLPVRKLIQGETAKNSTTEIESHLIEHLIEISDHLTKNSTTTPVPAWANATDYRLPNESLLLTNLQTIDEEIQKIEKQKEAHKEAISHELIFKKLLFEKGMALEDSIHETLQLMGFTTEKFRKDETEIDVIFTSEEGRFVGEITAKDNGQIELKKARQLLSNLAEDFEKNENSMGVLFGNAFRLKKPDERDQAFTDAVVNFAKKHNLILINTIDLFTVVKNLEQTSDKKYAESCRVQICKSMGKIVKFPLPQNE